MIQAIIFPKYWTHKRQKEYAESYGLHLNDIEYTGKYFKYHQAPKNEFQYLYSCKRGDVIFIYGVK